MITFLARAEQLMVDEWLQILQRARELRVQRLPAVRRLRDTIALDEPSMIGRIAMSASPRSRGRSSRSSADMTGKRA